MASMGERLAARRAGKTPKNIPIPEETPKAKTTAVKLIAAGNQILIKATIAADNKRPTAPPITDKTTDSVVTV